MELVGLAARGCWKWVGGCWAGGKKAWLPSNGANALSSSCGPVKVSWALRPSQ